MKNNCYACKGQQRKIKGVMCKVPIECDQTCNIFPPAHERSGNILASKIKRKLQFRGPEFLITALNWLKVNNPLYNDIYRLIVQILVQL